MRPNFSAYPFDRLRTLRRRDALVESTVARWIAAQARGERLARLVGISAVRAEVVAPGAFDPFAARCEVRVGGAALSVRGSSLAVRAIAQRLLGGPAELAAPRPLGVVERSIWALVVATALEDLGVAGEVWPTLDETDRVSGEVSAMLDDNDRGATRVERPRRASEEPATAERPRRAADEAATVELAVSLGDIALAVQMQAPADLLLRVPPARPMPAWFATTHLDVPIVVGRCALDRSSQGRLAVRSVVTLDRPVAAAELEILGGSVGLSAVHGAVVATVATGYVPRDMSLPDDAHLELTVALGTTRLSLREISDLAIGQVVNLGRPLAGPFELRAAGRVVGRGELVDVDGELAVRIVSLGDQEL
jgi:hypothetical protein